MDNNQAREENDKMRAYVIRNKEGNIRKGCILRKNISNTVRRTFTTSNEDLLVEVSIDTVLLGANNAHEASS